jgi:hypothetical protein
MKKIFFILTILGTFLIFSSCDKKDQAEEVSSTKNNIYQKPPPGPVAQVFSNLAWHRAIQRKNNGEFCNCASCFGICRIDPTEPPFGGNSIIYISSDLSYARIFSMVNLEDDNEFVIDYDITSEISSENPYFSETVRFLSGEYNYIPNEEELIINDETYTVYGSVDIDISIN